MLSVITLHLILRQCLSLSPKLHVWANLDIHLAPEILYLGFQWDHLIHLAFMCLLGIQIGPYICKASTLSTSFPDASFTLESLVFLIYFQYYDWVIRKNCNQDYWKPCGLVLDQYMSACLTGLQTRQKPTGTVSLDKNQWTSGQWRILLGPCCLHALFSLLIWMILLEALVSLCQSRMRQMWSFLGTLYFFSSIVPWNSLRADASRVSCLVMPALTLNLGSCSSVQTESEADHPYFCKYASHFESYHCFWKCMPMFIIFIFVKTECT